MAAASVPRMRIATFLPNTGVYGGVRRFIELGNAWVRAGHEVTLFHPEGTPPAWLPFAGTTAPLGEAGAFDADLSFCADPHTLALFLAAPSARRVYYCVIEKDPGVAHAQAAGCVLAANSGPLRRRLAAGTGRSVLDGIGGLNTAQFHPRGASRPADRLCVLVNGRRSRPKKGTDLVLAALRGVRTPQPLEVVLFDAPGPGDPDPRGGARLPAGARYVLHPTQDALADLYRSAHVFVAAERKAGWCNTALEAMACGAAVVCTRSGTTDFAHHGRTALVAPVRHPWFLRGPIRRALRDAALRERLSAAGIEEAKKWSWDRLAAKLLAQLGAR